MNDDINILIDKYLNGEATESERGEVDAWYRSFESKPGLLEQLSAQEAMNEMTRSFAAISQKLHLSQPEFNQRAV